MTFLLMAARRIDDHREALRRPSNRAYEDAHLHGCGRETLRGRTVGLVGFGRIGRVIAGLLRPFGARLLVHDPHVPARADHAGCGPHRDPPGDAAASRVPRPRGGPHRRDARDDRRAAVGAPPRRGHRRERGARRARGPRGADPRGAPRPPAVRARRDRSLGAAAAAAIRCAAFGAPCSRPTWARAALAVRRAMADIVLDTLERFFRGKRVTNRVTPAMLDLMT